MLHGMGTCTKPFPLQCSNVSPNVGKYIPYMEHLGYKLLPSSCRRGTTTHRKDANLQFTAQAHPGQGDVKKSLTELTTNCVRKVFGTQY